MAPEPVAIDRKNAIAIAAAALATSIAVFLIALSIPSFAKISDLPQYYAAADLLLHGHGSSIWLLDNMAHTQHELFPALAERIIPSYLPPVAVIYLLPLAAAPIAWLPVLWPCLLLAFVVAGLLVLKKCFALTNKQTLWVWAVVSISGPLFESIRIGQLAPILFLAFSLALAAIKRDRPWLAAICLSVLFFKPQELLPFVVYLLGARRYKFIGCLLVIAGVMAVLSFLLVGVSGWQNYFLLLSNSITNSVWMQPELCPTLRGQLLRLPLSTNVGNVISLFALLICLTAIFIIGHKAGTKPHWLEAGLIGAMPLGLAFTLHMHDYDLLLLIPSAVAMIKTQLISRLPSWLTLLSMFAFLVFLLPFYVYIHYDYLLKAGMINPLFLVLVVCSIGLAVLSNSKKTLETSP